MVVQVPLVLMLAEKGYDMEIGHTKTGDIGYTYTFQIFALEGWSCQGFWSEGGRCRPQAGIAPRRCRRRSDLDEESKK